MRDAQPGREAACQSLRIGLSGACVQCLEGTEGRLVLRRPIVRRDALDAWADAIKNIVENRLLLTCHVDRDARNHRSSRQCFIDRDFAASRGACPVSWRHGIGIADRAALCVIDSRWGGGRDTRRFFPNCRDERF